MSDIILDSPRAMTDLYNDGERRTQWRAKVGLKWRNNKLNPAQGQSVAFYYNLDHYYHE